MPIPYVDWEVKTRPGGVVVASGNTGPTGCATVSLPDGDYTLCGSYNPPASPPIVVPSDDRFAPTCRDFTVACPASDIGLSLDPAPGYHCDTCSFGLSDNLVMTIPRGFYAGTWTMTYTDTVPWRQDCALVGGVAVRNSLYLPGWVSECKQIAFDHVAADEHWDEGPPRTLLCGQQPAYPDPPGTVPVFWSLATVWDSPTNPNIPHGHFGPYDYGCYPMLQFFTRKCANNYNIMAGDCQQDFWEWFEDGCLRHTSNSLSSNFVAGILRAGPTVSCNPPHFVWHDGAGEGIVIDEA
jgi:hypothetical protein